MKYNTTRRFSKEEQLSICEDYKILKSCYKLADKYKSYAETIYRILKRNNIVLEKPGGRKNFDIKDFLFEKIDTEESAYWLGFIAADGNVSISSRNKSFTLTLAEKDRNHLEKFADFLNFDKKRIKLRKKDEKLYPCVNLSNKDLVNKLIFLGIVPQKSYKLKWNVKVPQSLMRHFIRGYFDGDGCWSFYEIKPMFEVIGTDEFTDGLQDFLIKSLQLNKTKKYTTGKNKIAKTVKYCGYRNSKKIYEFLYQGAKVFMNRKKEKIEHLLELNQIKYPKKYHKSDFVNLVQKNIAEIEQLCHLTNLEL